MDRYEQFHQSWNNRGDVLLVFCLIFTYEKKLLLLLFFACVPAFVCKYNSGVAWFISSHPPVYISRQMHTDFLPPGFLCRFHQVALQTKSSPSMLAYCSSHGRTGPPPNPRVLYDYPCLCFSPPRHTQGYDDWLMLQRNIFSPQKYWIFNIDLV